MEPTNNMITNTKNETIRQLNILRLVVIRDLVELKT